MGLLNQREEMPRWVERREGPTVAAAWDARRAPRSELPPLFFGNIFFHLLLMSTVYTSGPTRSQTRGRVACAAGGTSLAHVLGTVPKGGKPWILWIWFLPTVFCRVSAAGTLPPAPARVRALCWVGLSSARARPRVQGADLCTPA